MSDAPRRIAVTGAGGRLGRALLAAATPDPPLDAIGWSRPELDLDAPDTVVGLLDRDHPDLVIHAAAWTDVDGCARDPDLAMARNGVAAGVLARHCAVRGVRFVLVSTNEVFDGERTDGLGYREDDPVAPRNPYGASKLAGERAVRAAYADGPEPWIIRVAWLYGPPGNDFPRKIVAAADRLPPDRTLSVVADEVGTPTATDDLAGAILRLVTCTDGGVFHLAPTPPASRLDWARAVLALVRPERTVAPIGRDAFPRASDPPPWGVLDASRAARVGVVLPDWRGSLERHLAADPSVRPVAVP
jgi:dTDP-4-dehydrorhamnose reductase